MDHVKRAQSIDKIKLINSLLEPEEWGDRAIESFLMGYEMGKEKGNWR